MRLIDADVFARNVVKYSHQSTKTIGQALADTPTVDAIPMSVIEDIKAEIEEKSDLLMKHGGVYEHSAYGLDYAILIIDGHIGKDNE